MTFYRISITVDNGVSAGYEFFTSWREAMGFKNEYLRDNPGETVDWDIIRVDPTKAGILKALNSFARHPDNG